MRYIVTILFLFTSAIASSEELELNCKFDNYNGRHGEYSESLIKSWVPQIQKHVIKTNTTSYWNEARIEGRIFVNDSRKVKLKYKYTSKYIVYYNFVYFKTTKKASINVIFPGYIDGGSVWGTCEEIKNNYTNPVNNSNVNDESLENISDNLVCYRHGLYKGKYITEAKRRNLNCKPENENKTEKAENKCKELGFSPATESYGNCVLKLMD